MNSPPDRKNELRILERQYLLGLRRYLAQAPTASLQSATRLGHRAVTAGVGVLDLSLIHERVLLDLALAVHSTAARDRLIKRAGIFFAATIIPLGKTHRSELESGDHLNLLNHALRRRTLDLYASNRKLKEEIIRRGSVERILRRSELQSRRLLSQSRVLQGQLRHLSRRVLSAQEDERKRISRELHDVIAQVLAGINIRLAALKTDATANTKGLVRSIARAQKMVEKSVGIVHRFAYDLRPALLDHMGLIPALHSFVKGFMKATGIRVNLTVFAGVEKMSDVKRTTIYRIIQESLTNVTRHAQANLVDVRIAHRSNAVFLRIKDNGHAFNVAQKLRAAKNRRIGLLGMRERVEMVGGSFSVESVPGQGTTITAKIPFPNGDKRQTSS